MINGRDRSLLSTSVMWFVYRILVKFLISQKQISPFVVRGGEPVKADMSFYGDDLSRRLNPDVHRRHDVFPNVVYMRPGNVCGLGRSDQST